MKYFSVSVVMLCLLMFGCIGQKDGNMVFINGGTFTMGSFAQEPGRDFDEMLHQVTVNSFYMCEYEVTQREYKRLMKSNPSNFKGNNLPVESVSWYEALNYCNTRSLREGLTPVYTISGIGGMDIMMNTNANGYRLPTEAEWEYACRAGTTTPFSTGYNITTDQANYDGNFPYSDNETGTFLETTSPVGRFAANDWGLYDMHGNVFEWCWDLYDNYLEVQARLPESILGAFRVIRGGSWVNGAETLRSAYRGIFIPDDGNERIGFRVVRSAQ
jgi:formylglycine-generating enzyme required for sulfatase activity